MPTCSSHRRWPPPGGPTLQQLADILAESPGSPSLIRLVGREVGFAPLEDAHPVDRLTGFVAPAEWDALGAVVTGSAFPIEGGRRQRVHLVYLLARTGASASAVRGLHRDLEGPPSGRLVDVCHRALGLPTEPPAGPPREWWSVVWLDRIFAEAARSPSSAWTWRRVLALHPLGDATGADDVTWEDLRRLAAGRSTPGGAIDPDVAAWLDEGSFARHLLGDHLPLSTLLEEVAELLPGSVLERVRARLEAEGLPCTG